ncbi:MAG: anthranilate/aminodeoxychorismate synthase component II, partial [Bacteroidetes bacterium]
KHGKIDLVKHEHHPLFKGIPEHFKVTRYHSLILNGIKNPMKQIALGSQEECMALAHSQLPLFGVQFHPESCLTEYGLNIIKNYIDLVKQPV